MTYIEVAYLEEQWVATTVCDGTRKVRCVNSDSNLLLNEVSDWARLYQAEVRVIED